jgi:hypothetical protein
MSILPVSNIINVTISDTPSGLTERNVNSLALFTNEPSDSLNAYSINIGASTVAEEYGTDSVTAAMANAMFAQSPNLRSGNGRLVVIPMQGAVSATPANFVTANLSANLAAIIAVDDGDIKITVDGVAHNLTGVDFTNCTTWANVATVLQALLVDTTVTADTNGFTITSKKVGSVSSVAMDSVSGGAGTDLDAVGLFNGAAGTTNAGVNSSGETLLQAIARTKGAVSYAAVISNLNLEDAVIEATSDGIQAMDMLYFQHVASTNDIAGIGTTIQQSGNKKTRIILYTPGLAQANLMVAAYAGRALSVNFTGSFTSQTMNLKQLATITPDLGISQTLYEQAKIAGVDLYVSYDGVPSVLSTGGNDFFDNPYSDLALKFALETAGFNFLRQTNTKVPQTEQGMNGLKNAYAQICERFIRNGCVAAGAWTSSETFGNPEIFRNNILTRGYYVYSLPIVQQDATEREQRKAPLVQIAIKRAGAIQTSDVIVIVNA